MKKTACTVTLFAAIIAFTISFNPFTACKTQRENNANRLYFQIDPIDRKIVIPVQIQDSIIANLVFDTGASISKIDLDSTFCAKHPSIVYNKRPLTSVNGGSAWIQSGYAANVYEYSDLIKIGDANMEYDHLLVYDWRNYHNNYKTDGLFNISKYDSLHIWELNFEHNYLEIHKADNYKIPKDCKIFPLAPDTKSGYPFNITLPLDIKCSDNDTIKLHRTFMVDTGMPEDIALMCTATESAYFNKKTDAVWTQFSTDYNRYYNVTGSILSNIKLDSLRIYTYDFPNSVQTDYLIGQNFLKRFNVFIDMKNKQIGLQPLKKFERVVNPGHRRFHYSVYKTMKDQIIVKYVADYPENYYKTAGLKAGDEIRKINGKGYEEYTWEERKEFYKKDELIFEINRKGVPMKIVVKVNKNEKQGN